MRCGRKLNLTNVDSEHLEDPMLQKDPAKYHKAWEILSKSQGVSTPSIDPLSFCTTNTDYSYLCPAALDPGA